jgi:hypothetical protein
LHGRQIDHDAALANRVTRQAVAATAYRDQKIVAGGELHRSHHICRVGAARDQRGVAVESAVPDAPRGFETLTYLGEDRSALVGPEIGDVDGFECDGTAGTRDRRRVDRFLRARKPRGQAGRGHERHGTGNEVSPLHFALPSIFAGPAEDSINSDCDGLPPICGVAAQPDSKIVRRDCTPRDYATREDGSRQESTGCCPTSAPASAVPCNAPSGVVWPIRHPFLTQEPKQFVHTSCESTHWIRHCKHEQNDLGGIFGIHRQL